MSDLSAAEPLAAARGAAEKCDSIKRDGKFVARVRDACRSGEEQLLDRLIQSKARDHARALLDEKNLEHECVVGGSTRCLEMICKLLGLLPRHINRKNNLGYSSLHMAVLSGHTDIVDFLLVNAADVNITDNDQHSPLYHAIVLNNEKLVRRLLNAGADVHVADRFQATPLHYAVQMCQDGDAGAINIVKMLLDRVSTVEMRDSEGRTPLVWASSSGSLSAVQLLLKSKAIRTAADKDGLTALHCAAGHGYCQIIQALVCGTQDQFVNVEDSFGCPPIFYAASHGEHQAMSTLLHLGADADYQDKKGRTVSHCAAALGKPTLLRELEEKGANLWIKSHKQEYPLHEALANQHSDTVFSLLDRADNSIDPSQPNIEGETLLHMASRAGDKALVSYLLDKSVDVNAVYVDKDGSIVTPLDICDEKGHKVCSQLLKKQGGMSNRTKAKVQTVSQSSDNSKHQSLAGSNSLNSNRVNLSKPSHSQLQKQHRGKLKKEVKISEVVEVYSTCYVINNQKAGLSSPNKSAVGKSQQSALATSAGDQPHKSNPYKQTLLPYDSSSAATFVNVNSLITKPKGLVTKEGRRKRPSSVKVKVMESVSDYETIRNAAREVQDTYLRGPRPKSALPVCFKRDNKSSSQVSTPGQTTTSDNAQNSDKVSKVPHYIVIATRGGFTKIRSPPHHHLNKSELLNKLHHSKGNGILYVLDVNSNNSAGFTQGFDGRLRHRQTLELKAHS